MKLIRYVPILILILLILIAGCAKSEENLEVKTTSETVVTNTLRGIQTGIEVGDVPPNFKVTTIDGEDVELKDFSEKGRPVLVYFMATWCPFCAKDYAALSNIYQDYESKVDILSISLDLNENAEQLSEYKEGYPKLTGMMLAPGNIDVLTSYKVRSTTTKYAVDKGGKIIYKGAGAFTEDQWRTLLDALV